MDQQTTGTQTQATQNDDLDITSGNAAVGGVSQTTDVEQAQAAAQTMQDLTESMPDSWSAPAATTAAAAPEPNPAMAAMSAGNGMGSHDSPFGKDEPPMQMGAPSPAPAAAEIPTAAPVPVPTPVVALGDMQSSVAPSIHQEMPQMQSVPVQSVESAVAEMADTSSTGADTDVDTSASANAVQAPAVAMPTLMPSPAVAPAVAAPASISPLAAPAPVPSMNQPSAAPSMQPMAAMPTPAPMPVLAQAAAPAEPAIAQTQVASAQAGSDAAGGNTVVANEAPVAPQMTAPDTDQATYAASKLEEAAPKPRQNAKILVVEDEIDARTVFVDLLSSEGYETSSAVDGVDALAKAAADKFDLILLDIVMPNKDGIEVLHEIKNNPDKYGTPVVVMLTNISGDAAIEKAMEIGAAGFKLKVDTEPSQLLADVQAFLAGKVQDVNAEPVTRSAF